MSSRNGNATELDGRAPASAPTGLPGCPRMSQTSGGGGEISVGSSRCVSWSFCVILLPSFHKRSARIMHFVLSVCLFRRVTQKLLLRFTLIFVTQEVLRPWLGPPKMTRIWIRIWTQEYIYGFFTIRTKYAIKVCHNIKLALWWEPHNDVTCVVHHGERGSVISGCLVGTESHAGLLKHTCSFSKCS